MKTEYKLVDSGKYNKKTKKLESKTLELEDLSSFEVEKEKNIKKEKKRILDFLFKLNNKKNDRFK